MLARHLQSEALSFRQRPVLEDCFPSSVKEYREVEYEGSTMKVFCSNALLARESSIQQRQQQRIELPAPDLRIIVLCYHFDTSLTCRFPFGALILQVAAVILMHMTQVAHR